MPRYVETKLGGYPIELERKEFITSMASQMVATKTLDELRTTVTPAYMPVESQGRQGACRGHSGSTCQENVAVRYKHPMVQMSRAAFYYRTQHFDGIRGDRGSTIAGGAEFMTKEGLVTEDDWPYPSSYNPTPPRGYEQMEKVKSSGVVDIRSYEDVWRHISEEGPVDWGIGWSSGYDRQVSQDGLITRAESGASGHALALLGLSLVDWNGNALPGDGRPWVIEYNSWDLQWGYNGCAMISPQAMDDILHQRSTTAIGWLRLLLPEPDGGAGEL